MLIEEPKVEGKGNIVLLLKKRKKKKRKEKRQVSLCKNQLLKGT